MVSTEAYDKMMQAGLKRQGWEEQPDGKMKLMHERDGAGGVGSMTLTTKELLSMFPLHQPDNPYCDFAEDADSPTGWNNIRCGCGNQPKGIFPEIRTPSNSDHWTDKQKLDDILRTFDSLMRLYRARPSVEEMKSWPRQELILRLDAYLTSTIDYRPARWIEIYEYDRDRPQEKQGAVSDEPEKVKLFAKLQRDGQK